MTLPRVCLNMIVKNESAVIQRCLESVVNFIDFFVIVDTGSSDNTVEKIKTFFRSYNKKGFIKTSPFVNFEETRNLALELAYCFFKGEYIFFIDADMILVDNGFDKTTLEKDLYYITQVNNNLVYKNCRIVKNNRNFYYRGYTHEVIIPVKPTSVGEIKKILYISDHGDGGCKSNKVERDIKLLKMDIKRFPNFSRNYFYLANTYFFDKNYPSAIEFYQKRISFGGWKEEVWFSLYRIGLIKILEEKDLESINYFLKAIKINPLRLETYFFVLLVSEKRNLQKIKKSTRLKAKKIISLKPDTRNFLFYDSDICDKKIFKIIDA